MRKTKIIKIEDANRDHGKTFEIQEMDVFSAEKWLYRVLNLMGRSDIDIGDGTFFNGFAAGALDRNWRALIYLSIKALFSCKIEEAGPLLDEMMTCVRSYIIPADNEEGVVLLPFRRDQIEEIETVFTLRKEIFELHTNFSLADLASSLRR